MLTSLLLSALPAALLALLPARSPAPQTGCTGTEFFACQSNRILRGLVENDHLGCSISACGDWNWSGTCAARSPEGIRPSERLWMAGPPQAHGPVDRPCQHRPRKAAVVHVGLC